MMNQTSARVAGRLRLRIMSCMFAVCAALTLGVCAVQANAEEVLESPYEVSDAATHLQVDKLDAGNHANVKGASLCIVEKSSGRVIEEWVSNGTLHEVAATLDVDTEYILRETKAPSGYDAATDVVFKLKSDEGAGIQIVSGNKTAAGGTNVDLVGDYGLNLYDAKASTEKVVHKKRTTTNTVAPRTGDETPIGLVIGLGVLALVAAGVIQVAKRRMNAE